MALIFSLPLRMAMHGGVCRLVAGEIDLAECKQF
jgi:hypothetical protein